MIKFPPLVDAVLRRRKRDAEKTLALAQEKKRLEVLAAKRAETTAIYKRVEQRIETKKELARIQAHRGLRIKDIEAQKEIERVGKCPQCEGPKSRKNNHHVCISCYLKRPIK